MSVDQPGPVPLSAILPFVFHSFALRVTDRRMQRFWVDAAAAAIPAGSSRWRWAAASWPVACRRVTDRPFGHEAASSPVRGGIALDRAVSMRHPRPTSQHAQGHRDQSGNSHIFNPIDIDVSLDT